MEGKTSSPKRPRGPGQPVDPSVAQEHGHADSKSSNYAGTSRSTLFGLFRRQPSRSSLRSTTNPTASATTVKPVANAGSGVTASHSNYGGSRGTAVQSLRSSAGESFSAAFDHMSFNASAAGLESPQQARETAERTARMLDAAERYERAIEAMSDAAAEFGAALYECADTKGAAAGRTALPDHSVDVDLQAAGGLHMLISNHARILAASLRSRVVEAGRQHHNIYEQSVSAKEVEFRTNLRAKMAALREADAQRQDTRRRSARAGGGGARRSKRGSSSMDLNAYRSTLLDLTSQIDDINRLKFEFLGDLHVLSTDLAESLHSALASATTAEIEVFESIARKGWSGGGLDGLLAGCPDPFEPENNGVGARSVISHSPVSHSGSILSVHRQRETDGETVRNGNSHGSAGSTTSIHQHSGGSSVASDASDTGLYDNEPLPERGSSLSTSNHRHSGLVLPLERDDDDDDDEGGKNQDTHRIIEQSGDTGSTIEGIEDLTLTPQRTP